MTIRRISTGVVGTTVGDVVVGVVATLGNKRLPMAHTYLTSTGALAPTKTSDNTPTLSPCQTTMTRHNHPRSSGKPLTLGCTQEEGS